METQENRKTFPIRKRTKRDGKIITQVRAGQLTKLKYKSLSEIFELTHSFEEFVSFLEILTSVSIEIVITESNTTFNSASRDFILLILKSYSEFSRKKRSLYAKQGVKKARESGKAIGRPRSINLERVRELKVRGYSLTRISKDLGVSTAAIHKAIKNNNL